MRYLIDTNIALFLLFENGSVDRDTMTIIEDFGNRVYISAESLKEMASVYRKKPYLQKKWKTCKAMVEFLCEEYNLHISYPNQEHYRTFLRLEWNEAEQHHDPSDLIIIAHAITERMTLISSDRKFHFYRAQGLSLIYNKP